MKKKPHEHVKFLVVPVWDKMVRQLIKKPHMEINLSKKLPSHPKTNKEMRYKQGQT